MPSPRKSSPTVLRQRVNRYGFALACAVLLVVASALIAMDNNLSRDQALSNVGLNVFSSIVFAIVFSWLSTRNQENNLLETLSDQFEAQNARIMERIHETTTQYLPNRTYQAADDFDREFNRDVSSSLRRSRLYAFRGTSAKYVPARIQRSSRRPDQVRIIMLDPSDEPAMHRRAVDRQRQPKLHDRTIEELIDEAKAEVCMSLVALFDIRHLCPIEVLLTDEPVITRMELFDDSVYFSWYQGPNSPSRRFPETVRFSDSSFAYQVERLGVVKQFERSHRVIRFDGGHDPGDLLEYMTKYTKDPVTPEMIDKWRNDYANFISSFNEHLAHVD